MRCSTAVNLSIADARLLFLRFCSGDSSRNAPGFALRQTRALFASRH